MDRAMDKIYEKMNNRFYHQAVILLEEAEKNQTINPNILVLKGMCLQLDNDESKYDLQDIENMFKEAFQMDKECINSIVELAWFNLNVNDDPRQAISLFKEALNAYSSKITEVVIGITKCLIETDSSEEVIKYLEGIETQILDTSKIESIREEIVTSQEWQLG
jgi:lipopolysaccharide biosynthesis regulator YciM